MSKIIIIGGGIIGLCAGEKLIAQGHSVTLVEQKEIAAGASYGNAAGLAFSEIMPMASVSTILQSLRWCLDPSGPFSIVPKDLPHTAGWLMSFAMASRKSVFERSIRVQSELMSLSRKTLPGMLQRTGLNHMVQASGALYLYDTKAQYESAKASWLLRAEQGIEYRCLEEDALHDFQPGLAKTMYGGVHVSKYQSVTDPNDLCQGLHRYLEQNSMETIYEKVVSLSISSSGVVVELGNGQRLNADKVVLAAGPWSGEIAKQLGDNIPMIGERGYNTTLPKSAMPNLPHTLFFGPHGFVMSPLANGVRVGGGSEIARIDRPPNFRRSEALLQKAKTLVPSLITDNGKQWMGIRPTTTDTLPVIGRSTKSDHVIYAFGHGHLGLTQSTATAQLISELVDDAPASLDLTNLSATRF